MPSRLFGFVVLLCTAALLPARPGAAPPGSWMQWRGPTGQGHSDDAKVPLVWGEDKNVLWKTPLPGGGNSTPVVAAGRIFLTTATSGGAGRGVVCVGLADGKVLWERTSAKDVPEEKSHAWNGHASPSCVTDGKHVWAFFGSPGLFCYDLDGKLVWSKSFGVFTSQPGWGTGASPFLYGDTVIVNCDNDGGRGAAPANLIALEKLTGKQAWSTPRRQGRGFSTPRLLAVGGREDLILNGPEGVWAYDPATGKERWRVRRTDPDEKHKFGEPMPVDDGSHLFIQSGRQGPYQVVKLSATGEVKEGDVVHTGIRKGHRDVSSAVAVGGRAFAVDQNANLSAYDLKTGKETGTLALGNRRNRSLGSPITLRGKLVWVLDDGSGFVLEPGDKPKILHRNKLDGESLDFGASPAVADGKMLLRSQKFLYCIGEK